jgi:hypothetical protein
VPDDTVADGWAAAVRSGAHDAPSDVFAGPPAGPWALEQERLTAIDRERLDRDDDLI